MADESPVLAAVRRVCEAKDENDDVPYKPINDLVMMMTDAASTDEATDALMEWEALPWIMDLVNTGVDEALWLVWRMADHYVGRDAHTESVVRASVVDLGGVPMLVHLLTNPGTRKLDVPASYYASGLLGDLSHVGASVASAIVQAGAIPLLLGMLETDAEKNDDSYEYALLMLASKHTDHKRAIVEAGGLPSIAKKAANFHSDVDDENDREYAFRLLMILVVHAPKKERAAIVEPFATLVMKCTLTNEYIRILMGQLISIAKTERFTEEILMAPGFLPFLRKVVRDDKFRDRGVRKSVYVLLRALRDIENKEAWMDLLIGMALQETFVEMQQTFFSVSMLADAARGNGSCYDTILWDHTSSDLKTTPLLVFALQDRRVRQEAALSERQPSAQAACALLADLSLEVRTTNTPFDADAEEFEPTPEQADRIEAYARYEKLVGQLVETHKDDEAVLKQGEALLQELVRPYHADGRPTLTHLAERMAHKRQKLGA